MSGLRFGLYLLDPATGELSKNGRRVPLQQQPLRVLMVLLERPGELVLRDELRHRIWGDDVNVEFDQSLNKSITKLRDALGDTANSPRFIETLPKRGYRFIAPVSTAEAAMEPPVESPPPAVEQASDVPSHKPDSGSVPAATHPASPMPVASRIWLSLLLIAVLAAAAAMVVTRWQPAGSVQAREEPPAGDATRPRVDTPIFAARDAFERGRLAVSRRTPEALEMSVELFTRATVLSPRYAEAYAGLADSWSLMASYGLVDPREGMPRAREAANRALSIDPTLARAHASLGRTAMIFDWDWPTAGWHFAQALSLDPGHTATHQWHAYYLSARGEHANAEVEARRAIASEPLSLNANTALGLVLYLARRYDDAAFQLERTLEIDPDFAQARRNLALVRVQQGRLDEAVESMGRVARLNERSLYAQAELAWVQGLHGQHEAARATLATLDRRRESEFVSPDGLALIYLGLGASDEAVSWLQRAFTMRVASLSHLPVDPVWDPIREHPRVQQIVNAITRR